MTNPRKVIFITPDQARRLMNGDHAVTIRPEQQVALAANELGELVEGYDDTEPPPLSGA